MPKITPYLWFDAPLEEPIAYYRSVFSDVHVHSQSSGGAEFEIEGQRKIEVVALDRAAGAS